jgi:hypothetical protein
MANTTVRAGWTLLLVLGIGCSGGGSPGGSSAPAGGEQKAVLDAFIALQAALKEGDADKLWAMLDADSQAEAERAAKAIQAAYAKASAEEKAEQEKALGLPGAELAGLTGKGFLKTRRFQGKYDEIPESKVEKVAAQGEKATVNYVEPDGDHEKLTFVRQEGQWKVSLRMPK